MLRKHDTNRKLRECMFMSPPSLLFSLRMCVCVCACGVCVQYVKNQRKLTCMRRIKRTIRVYSLFVLFLQQNQTKASNFICYHIYVIDFVDWLALRFRCVDIPNRIVNLHIFVLFYSHVNTLRFQSYVCCVLCALVCWTAAVAVVFLLFSFICLFRITLF